MGGSSWFDDNSDIESPGKYKNPNVPTLGTAYGTTDGMPDPNYASGSPYFGLGGTLPSQAPFPNAEMGWGDDGNPNIQPTEQAMSAQPFSWTVPESPDSGGGNYGGGGGGGYGGYGAFQAPTGVDMLNAPGYKFRLAEAQKALENGAASHGTLLSGDFQKSLTNYIGNAASQEYQNVFNNALQGYSATASAQNAANANNNQAASVANQGRSIEYGHEQDLFGRSYSLASLGLNAAQLAAGASTTYGQNSANLSTSYGQNLANLYGTQGSVNAYGSAAKTNIWSQIPGSLASLGQVGVMSKKPSTVDVGDSGYGGWGGGY